MSDVDDDIAEAHVHSAPALFAPDAFRGLARHRLLKAPPAGDLNADLPPDVGDHDLNAGQPMTSFHDGPPRRAAVLVPVIGHESGATVLLTRRTEHLAAHAGQVAFPGGKIEGTDATPLAAALRETEEEIGIPAEKIDPLGYLDLYQTGTGFRIVPVVATVAPGYRLRIDENEVADVFEVPLAFLMTPDNHKRDSRVFKGLERHFYAMPYRDNYIWGATAGIIRNLYNRIYR
ncbi:CoA pyrophosphatase [Microbaculum marinisediminis]|uniref:CoA pyrophosphatase n=1 Tax=Microbaculum marinisediminis TaxID=2931392 RepID=A0AAW5QZS5_9HYPH|nr:CoA pyrophosphatase [Microbaculum sp. A6E488]MCT8971923.1 CoA pyrophosphatase [Microbaculum sp. A6E488]